MANEIEHVGTTGLHFYAKPTPLVYASWANDAEDLAETATDTGYYSADVVSPADGYLIYQRAGGAAANTDTIVGTVSTVAQQILALATDIEATTDKFTFDVNNIVDANIQYINDTEVNGNGVSPKWGP